MRRRITLVVTFAAPVKAADGPPTAAPEVSIDCLGTCWLLLGRSALL